MGCHFLLQGNLPDPDSGIEPMSPAWQADFFSLQAESLPRETPGKPQFLYTCVLVSQSCPTLCDPTNCGPPGSAVHGIFQARILEWVAIPFSRGSCGPQGSNAGLPHCGQILNCLSYQGIPEVIIRVKNWESSIFPTWIFPTQGLNLHLPYCRQILYLAGRFFTLQADSLPSEPPGKPHFWYTDPQFSGLGNKLIFKQS